MFGYKCVCVLINVSVKQECHMLTGYQCVLIKKYIPPKPFPVYNLTNIHCKYSYSLRTSCSPRTSLEKVEVLVAQSCPTLCNPLDCSLPDFSSMGFSRREYWSGLPCPLPGHLPDPGIEPWSPTLHVDCLLSDLPGKPQFKYKNIQQM